MLSMKEIMFKIIRVMFKIDDSSNGANFELLFKWWITFCNVNHAWIQLENQIMNTNAVRWTLLNLKTLKTVRRLLRRFHWLWWWTVWILRSLCWRRLIIDHSLGSEHDGKELVSQHRRMRLARVRMLHGTISIWNFQIWNFDIISPSQNWRHQHWAKHWHSTENATWQMTMDMASIIVFHLEWEIPSYISTTALKLNFG